MDHSNSTNSINVKQRLVKYFKNNFSKKNNIWRLIGFVIGVVIVLIPSMTCNLMIRNGTWPWDTVQHNPGIAFGSLDGHVGLVYFLQTFICFIVLVAIVFTDKWYYSILLSLAFVGGMFNVIDRATQLSPYENEVIDYLPTGWIFKGTTSNFPDVFILTGIIGFAVLYTIMSIVTMLQDKKPKYSKTKDEKDKR